jgi:hypothetical protein
VKRTAPALIGLSGVLATAAFSALAATTYNYTGPLYTTVSNHTTCVVGTCADYSTSMRVTGSFTVNVPLAANLSGVDISTSANLLSWSFFDGVNTISSVTPNASIYPGFFRVSTNASGNVTSATDIVVEMFTTSVGTGFSSRVNSIGVGDSAPGDYGLNNQSCLALSGNSCTNSVSDANSSDGVNFSPGSWSSPALTVPTLSKAALFILFVMCGIVGLWFSRRVR